MCRFCALGANVTTRRARGHAGGGAMFLGMGGGNMGVKPSVPEAERRFAGMEGVKQSISWSVIEADQKNNPNPPDLPGTTVSAVKIKIIPSLGVNQTGSTNFSRVLAYSRTRVL